MFRNKPSNDFKQDTIILDPNLLLIAVKYYIPKTHAFIDSYFLK